MSPRHRDLADVVAQLARDKQDLRIESPALDPLQPEDHLRHRPLERLEAALRILERQPHHHPGHPVEAAPEEPPVQRLMDGLPRLVHPARSDRDIRAIRNRGQQPLRFFHRRRKVRIGEHHHLAHRLQQPVAHRVALAPVALILDQVQPRIPLHPAMNHLRRPVRRSVVDHQHLCVPALFLDARHHPLQRLLNAGALVVRRNHDAQLRTCHRLPKYCRSPFARPVPCLCLHSARARRERCEAPQLRPHPPLLHPSSSFGGNL